MPLWLVRAHFDGRFIEWHGPNIPPSTGIINVLAEVMIISSLARTVTANVTCVTVVGGEGLRGHTT